MQKQGHIFSAKNRPTTQIWTGIGKSTLKLFEVYGSRFSSFSNKYSNFFFCPNLLQRVRVLCTWEKDVGEISIRIDNWWMNRWLNRLTSSDCPHLPCPFPSIDFFCSSFSESLIDCFLLLRCKIFEGFDFREDSRQDRGGDGSDLLYFLFWL